MLKRILGYVLRLSYFFLSAYFLPILLTFAFNYSKGIQNNEDGILFIPFAMLLIVITVLSNVLSTIRMFRTNKDNPRGRLLIITALSVIFIVSVLLTLSNWQSFFEYFAYYKGLNLTSKR